MKKLHLLSFSVIGLSLAIAGGALLNNKTDEFRRADALPGTCVIGNHNFYESSTCSEYTGTATFAIESNEVVISLDNFDNGNSYFSAGQLTTGLIVYNSDLSVRIKVKGNCTIRNSSTAGTTAYGALITTNSDKQITIVGEGTGATLNVVSANRTGTNGESEAVFFSTQSLNVSNCVINATSGVAYKNSFGMDVLGALNVGTGSTINATAGGINTTDESDYYYAVGIYAKSYNQTAGEVTATAGNVTARGSSVGLKVNNGNLNISNGKLRASAGNSKKFSSLGIDVRNGSVIIGTGAEVTASSGTMNPKSDREDGARSYGIQLGNVENNYVQVNSDANYLYAYTAHQEKIYARGVNYALKPSFSGYASNSNIFSDDNRSVIEAGTYGHLEYYQFLFQRVQYTATTTPVTYDGDAHAALSLSVTYPTNSTLKYRLKGTTAWSITVPTFTDANESGYVVEYSISHSGFVTVIGEANFIIYKASSSVVTNPTEVDDFNYDGTSHALVNAGTASGGTLVYSINGGDYSSNIPTVINAGTYVVTYKVAGDGNHNDTDPVALNTVVVHKISAVFVIEPTAKVDLVANGEAQALANAGSTEDGTIVYRLGDSGEFSETVPTATEAGTYNVYYQLRGDLNHTDSDVKNFSVSVAEAPVPPTPVPPEPTPVDPTNPSGGLPGWAIALIIVGGLLTGCFLFLLVLFLFFPRYIVDYSTKTVIRTIYVKKHLNMVLMYDTHLRKVRRHEVDVYRTRKEAEEALRNR